MSNAVSRLRSAGLMRSVRPRLDRGDRARKRCDGCRLIASHCLCAWSPSVETRSGVCLVMGEFEPLKPSNTGWLVADVVPDTHAVIWSRTAVDPALSVLLADPRWQPFLVFPDNFDATTREAADSAIVGSEVLSGAESIAVHEGKRPLFVLLDATWPEARKMFRKSPYLARLPRLSLEPQRPSRYHLRSSEHAHYLCTSEVAAICLRLADDTRAADVLDAYLDVFTDHYRKAGKQKPVDGNDAVHRRLQALVEGTARRKGDGGN